MDTLTLYAYLGENTLGAESQLILLRLTHRIWPRVLEPDTNTGYKEIKSVLRIRIPNNRDPDPAPRFCTLKFRIRILHHGLWFSLLLSDVINLDPVNYFAYRIMISKWPPAG